jgi:hypothetical protein
VNIWPLVHSDRRLGVRLIAEGGYGNLFAGSFSTMTITLRMMLSCLRSPLQTKMDHPHYSLDLATCEFWLISKFKKMPWWDKDLLTFLTSKARWHYCEIFQKTIFKTVSCSGTIISQSAELHKLSTSKATAAARAQASKFGFHRAIK